MTDYREGISFKIGIESGQYAEVDMTKTSTQIAISDSIYRFLPSIDLIFQDSSGMIQESRACLPGGRIGVSYNDSSGTVYKMDTKVVSSESMDQSQSGYMGGGIHIQTASSLMAMSREFHVYPKSTYKNIQEIVENVGRTSPDKNLRVEKDNLKFGSMLDTYETSVYNPYMNAPEFIEDILLPLSIDDKLGSQYCFIDATNALVFTPSDGFFSKSSEVPTCYLMATTGAPDDEFINKYGDTPMWSMFPFTSEFKKFDDSIDIAIGYLESGDNDDVVKKDLSLGLTGSKDRYLPILRKDPSYSVVSDTKYVSERELNRKIAHTLYDRRKHVFCEHLQVTTPFNLSIHAGSMVYMKYLSYDGKTLDESSTLIGNWIVEESVHMWNGVKQSGVTRATLGRMYTTVNDSSKTSLNPYYRSDDKSGKESFR